MMKSGETDKLGKQTEPANAMNNSSDEVEIDLMEFMYTLLQNYRWIVISGILLAAIAALYTWFLVTPLYEATAKLYVLSSKESAINLADLQIGAYLTNDYKEVFKTWEVQEQVMQHLGVDYSYSDLAKMVRVENPANTRILNVTVKSSSPEEATAMANEYARVTQKYISDTMQTEEPSILSVALQPLYPTSPNKVQNVLVGLLIGIFGACSVIFVRFIFDDKIKTADDIGKYAGLTTLVAVPQIKTADKTGNAALADRAVSGSPETVFFSRMEQLDYAVDEAINTLSTNLSFIGKDKKIIMMTSCQPSEGKTFLALNLMAKLTQLGKRVVFVDTDLRRSILTSTYGIRLPLNYCGLTHYLAGMCSANDILFPSNLPGAFMVPVGRIVSSSLALLSSPLLKKLLQDLSEKFDFVIVDTPPIGTIIDAAEVAKSCDGALITVAYNQVTRKELKATRQQIELTGCSVLGAVLNNVDLETLSNKKYYNYRSYYSANTKESRGFPKKKTEKEQKRTS